MRSPVLLALAALAVAGCRSGAPSTEPPSSVETPARLGDVIGDVDVPACATPSNDPTCTTVGATSTTAAVNPESTETRPTAPSRGEPTRRSTVADGVTGDPIDRGDGSTNGAYLDRFLLPGPGGSTGTLPSSPAPPPSIPVPPLGEAPVATSTTSTTVTFPPPPVP